MWGPLLLSSLTPQDLTPVEGSPGLNKLSWEVQDNGQQQAAASDAQECAALSHGSQTRLPSAPVAVPQLGSQQLRGPVTGYPGWEPGCAHCLLLSRGIRTL